MNVLLLKAWLGEQGPALIGARLRAVRQHDERSILLELAGESGPRTLLLSVLEEYPALVLIADEQLLPAGGAPESSFAKALNFHLAGYKLASIAQAGFDRSVLLTFRQRDTYGRETLKVLRHELVGRASNAFLLSERGMVVSMFKRVRQSQNRVRRIITGKPLPDPPPLGKFVAADGGIDELAGELGDTADLAEFFSRRVACCDVKLWPAVEPQLPVEYDLESLLSFIARLQRGELTAQLFGLHDHGDANELALENWSAARLKRGTRSRPADQERQRAAARLDQLLRQRALAARADEVEQLALELLRQAEQLDAGEGAAQHLTSWQRQHPDWAEQIALDRSAYDNAQELVHYAQRLRRGVGTVEEKIDAAQAELARIERGAPAGTKKRKAADPLATASRRLERDGIKYLRFVSSDGLHIVCGVSDRSNDALLRVFGSSRHLWLHARDFSGSHVIVLSGGQDVPRRTLEEAALIAAWHSKGRKDADVEVSYLSLKHLRRVKGGKPGHVLKTQEKVISVRPARFETVKDRLHYSGR